MKKLIVTAFAVTALVACSSGVYGTKPVTQPIKQLCVAGNPNKAPSNFLNVLVNSLKSKGITAKYVRHWVDENCQYGLKFSARGDSVLQSARVVVQNLGTKEVLGSTSYKNRGDEVDRVEKTGLQGQTDSIINELFKSN